MKMIEEAAAAPVAAADDDGWYEEPEKKVRDKVFMNNVPDEITKNGIWDMCSAYGDVKNVIRLDGKKIVFVTFSNNAEALNMLRNFKNDHPTLPIFVDFARDRESHAPRVDAEAPFFEKACAGSSGDPFRNEFHLDDRKVQGPFTNPPKVYDCSPLIDAKDCQKLSAGAKEFVWNSNDETVVDYEKRQKKMVHGRAVIKSSLTTTNNNSPSTTVNNAEERSFRFNSDLLPSILDCSTCRRPADMTCKVCDKSTCSLECHATRKNEIAVGKDDKANDELALVARQIGKHVKLTAVINHRLVFVRPAGAQDEVEFARLQCDTAKYAKNAETMRVSPAVGAFVLAQFGGYYQRGLVLKQVADTKVAVAFIDFGNVDTIDIHELKAMPDQLKQIKRFATKIALSGIDDDLMNDKALTILYDYLIHDVELQIEIAPKNVPTEVITAKLRADQWLNELINSLNMFGVMAADTRHYEDLIRSIDQKPLNEQMANAIILCNSRIQMGEISFIDADDLQKFRENDRRIQNVCNFLFSKEEVYTPREGEQCVVHHGDEDNGGNNVEKAKRWYRAECIEVRSDGFATVVFIDYGNVNYIEINYIRPIPNCLRFYNMTVDAICLPPMREPVPIKFDPNVQRTEKELEELKKKAEEDMEQQCQAIEREVDQLKKKYHELSSWKVQKIGVRTKTDEYQNSFSEVYATLQ